MCPFTILKQFSSNLDFMFSQKQNFVKILMKKVEAVTHQVGVAYEPLAYAEGFPFQMNPLGLLFMQTFCELIKLCRMRKIAFNKFLCSAAREIRICFMVESRAKSSIEHVTSMQLFV